MRKGIRTLETRRAAVTAGRVTAELSFGFWRNMLLPKYEAALWTPVHTHFQDLPANVGLLELEGSCERVRILRNRVSHHEPLIGRNITIDYSQTLELLRWLSSEKEAWLKPRLEIMAILRQRP